MRTPGRRGRGSGRGRRQRRLLWTWSFVLSVLAVAALVMAWQAWRHRPVVHRPGEELAEVTHALSLDLPDGAPRPRFTDVTMASGLAFDTFAGARTSRLPEDMGGGAAWGDFDNDGDDDLFLVSNGGALDRPATERAPSLLFENRGGGQFRQVATFPDTRIIGMAAAWADTDNDGWLDLVVTGHNDLLLFRNHGGDFTRDMSFPSPAGFWTGASWADYDRDGDLDLYVCGYVHFERLGAAPPAIRQYGHEVPYTLNPSSYEPQANLLLENDGSGQFVDVAGNLGVDNPDGRSLGALWHDLDDDGWPDLYVANDISDNVLFLNRQGRFEDVSHGAWVADYRGAMGLAAGDWNNDGDDDLFVTHWIAQENALYDSLLISSAGGVTTPLRFMDVADMRGLGQAALHSVGWGTEFADLDADGWLDLIVANGSTFETDAVPPRLRPQVPFLFWNQQGAAFHDIAPLDEALSIPRVGRGLALSDHDADGDLDLLLVDLDGGVRLLRNDTPHGHTLQLRLRRRGATGTVLARAEGSRAVLTVLGRSLRRTVGGVSYLSQSSTDLHFGLGTATEAEHLEIRWPDGTTETYDELTADSLWEITQGLPAPRLISRTSASTTDSVTATPAADTVDTTVPPIDRQRITEFWRVYREGVRALRVDGNAKNAAPLLEQALALDPGHEDALYYLAQSRVVLGDVDAALEGFAELTRRHPASHRGHRAWALVRARHATTTQHIDDAVAALVRAQALNPEETGALFLRGELAILRGTHDEADRWLALVLQANPQASTALWLRGYIAWQGGDADGTARWLRDAQATQRAEKRPAGSTAEGDVKGAAPALATSLLSTFFDAWAANNEQQPATAFAPLQAHLDSTRQRLGL